MLTNVTIQKAAQFKGSGVTKPSFLVPTCKSVNFSGLTTPAAK